jgi:hypothetical protein
MWALAAAVLYGTGAALQQRQAAAAPSQAAGRPRLLLLLVQRPWWLLGIGVELGGFATHAVALRTGPLTIVQLLVASSLLFSVATVRLWSGRRLGWTAWAAVLAVIIGIASFVALAPPAGGVPGVSGHAGLAAACLAICAVPLAAAGLAAAGRRRAVLLAVAAGLADAGIAVVTMVFSHVVSGGLTGMAGSWATYALMLGGPCSLLLTQTAYQAGRPMITLPVIAVVTPVASLAAGSLLLGESARLGVLGGAFAALAVLVTSAGLVVLARLATGQPGPVGGQGSSITWAAFPASGPGTVARPLPHQGLPGPGELWLPVSYCWPAHFHQCVPVAEGSADLMARLQWLCRSQAAGDDEVAGLKRAATLGELLGQPDQPGGRMTARRGTDRAFHDLAIHRQRDLQ